MILVVIYVCLQINSGLSFNSHLLEEIATLLHVATLHVISSEQIEPKIANVSSTIGQAAYLSRLDITALKSVLLDMDNKVSSSVDVIVRCLSVLSLRFSVSGKVEFAYLAVCQMDVCVECRLVLTDRMRADEIAAVVKCTEDAFVVL